MRAAVRQVQDAVRSHQAVVLGFRDARGAIRLGPHSSARAAMQPEERLVVISYE